MGTSIRIDDLLALGRAIKDRRNELGYTQETAAEVLGIGRRLLIELERGQRSVRMATVLKVLAGLGLDLHVELRAHRKPGPPEQMSDKPGRL